jgi:uncharacterized membrane protein
MLAGLSFWLSFPPVLAWDMSAVTVNITITVRPLVAPTVTNGIGATNVGALTARLNGEVTNTGNENPTVTVFYGLTDGGTNTAAWDDNDSLGIVALGTCFRDVSGLLPTTLYYYRMRATNGGGVAWAASSANFTTTVYTAPTVGERSPPVHVEKTNNLTGITVILLLAMFCVLGFWKQNVIIFMILTCISLPLGLSAPDILSSDAVTTPADIGFAMMMIMFAFLCSVWAMRLLFWRDVKNA